MTIEVKVEVEIVFNLQVLNGCEVSLEALEGFKTHLK